MNLFFNLSKAIPHRIIPNTNASSTIQTKQFVTSLGQNSFTTKKDCISQGHTTDPSNKHQQDIQSQYVRGGKAARAIENFGIDAASPNTRPNPGDKTLGNPEGIGMLEQVGSASGTAAFFKAGGIQGEGFLRNQ